LFQEPWSNPFSLPEQYVPFALKYPVVDGSHSAPTPTTNINTRRNAAAVVVIVTDKKYLDITTIFLIFFLARILRFVGRGDTTTKGTCTYICAVCDVVEEVVDLYTQHNFLIYFCIFIY
jgi:hypothetical protein